MTKLLKTCPGQSRAVTFDAGDAEAQTCRRWHHWPTWWWRHGSDSSRCRTVWVNWWLQLFKWVYLAWHETVKAFDSTYPPGPSSLVELFDWHVSNTNTLFSDESLRSSFVALMSEVDEFILHEDYSGMGTAGSSLVQQFHSMKSAVAASLPDGCLPGFWTFNFTIWGLWTRANN